MFMDSNKGRKMGRRERQDENAVDMGNPRGWGIEAPHVHAGSPVKKRVTKAARGS